MDDATEHARGMEKRGGRLNGKEQKEGLEPKTQPASTADRPVLFIPRVGALSSAGSLPQTRGRSAKRAGYGTALMPPSRRIQDSSLLLNPC